MSSQKASQEDKMSRLCRTEVILDLDFLLRALRVSVVSMRTKQSQFASGGPGRPSPRPEALTLPPVTGGKRAKQSQFARIGEGWARDGKVARETTSADRCAKQTQFVAWTEMGQGRRAHRASRRPGQSCETKPISRCGRERAEAGKAAEEGILGPIV
jgi:hypothetical protein